MVETGRHPHIKLTVEKRVLNLNERDQVRVDNLNNIGRRLDAGTIRYKGEEVSLTPGQMERRKTEASNLYARLQRRNIFLKPTDLPHSIAHIAQRRFN